jgi:flagellar motor switch/type III secretory pathway protein FliN
MGEQHQDILAFRRPGVGDDESSNEIRTDLVTGRESTEIPPTANQDASSKSSFVKFPQPLRASGPQPFQWLDLREEQPPLSVTIQLGKARVPAREELRRLSGKILPLDQNVQSSVEIVVGGQVIGYGDLVVVQGKLAIAIKHVVETRQRRSA